MNEEKKLSTEAIEGRSAGIAGMRLSKVVALLFLVRRSKVIADVTLAVEIVVQGGGLAVLAGGFVLLVSGLLYCLVDLIF